MASMDWFRWHHGSVALARARNTRYNVPKSTAKKAMAGCESPTQFAVKSRNRTVCGFFHCTSYGGAVGMAQAMPVFAPRVVRSLTSNSTAAKCESLLAEFLHNSEPIMELPYKLPAELSGATESISESIYEAEIEARIKEKIVERAILNQLFLCGDDVHSQIKLKHGIADIIEYGTNTIYEVKAVLNRASIFNAIGQLMVYASCMENPSDWKLAIAGIDHPDIQSMKPELEKIGIMVQIYEKDWIESWSK